MFRPSAESLKTAGPQLAAKIFRFQVGGDLQHEPPDSETPVVRREGLQLHPVERPIQPQAHHTVEKGVIDLSSRKSELGLEPLRGDT